MRRVLVRGSLFFWHLAHVPLEGSRCISHADLDNTATTQPLTKAQLAAEKGGRDKPGSPVAARRHQINST